MSRYSASFALVLAFAFCMSLTSCGLIKDRSSDYMQAMDSRDLKVLEWHSDEKISPRYPIPEIPNQRTITGDFKLPLPPDGTAAVNSEPYVLEEIDGQAWVHLYTAPGKVWPMLDHFWTSMKIPMAYENVAKGFAETSALDAEGAHAGLLKTLAESEHAAAYTDGTFFQAKVTQGVRRNTSELHIRAIVPGSNDDVVKGEWQEARVNELLEKALLDEIGKFVTSDTQANRYSLLANDLGSDSRVKLLQTNEGKQYLEFDLAFWRAWAEVDQALASAGIIVSDRNRTEKVIYVSYLSEEDIDGWFVSETRKTQKRLEQNLSLTFKTNDENKLIVEVAIENPKVSQERADELLNLMFEHIS